MEYEPKVLIYLTPKIEPPGSLQDVADADVVLLVGSGTITVWKDRFGTVEIRRP